MANRSTSPSDEGEPSTRSASQHEFLSHLHARRSAGVRYHRAIATNGDNLLSKDHPPVEPRGRVDALPERRSLAITFGMAHRGDANVNNSKNGGPGAAHDEQQEEASGTTTRPSCESSKNAVARFQPTQTAPSLGGVPPRFRGSTVRDNWSEHAGNPDGEFTFRCSSTMQRTRASNDSPGFDLVGSILTCVPSESPVSSVSSHRYSGKRCV